MDELDNCIICLEPVQIGENASHNFPCNCRVYFHRNCWEDFNRQIPIRRCPICRSDSQSRPFPREMLARIFTLFFSIAYLVVYLFSIENSRGCSRIFAISSSVIFSGMIISLLYHREYRYVKFFLLFLVYITFGCYLVFFDDNNTLNEEARILTVVTVTPFFIFSIGVLLVIVLMIPVSAFIGIGCLIYHILEYLTDRVRLSDEVQRLQEAQRLHEAQELV